MMIDNDTDDDVDYCNANNSYSVIVKNNSYDYTNYDYENNIDESGKQNYY